MKSPVGISTFQKGAGDPEFLALRKALALLEGVAGSGYIIVSGKLLY
jgi:hypothetical protein